MPMLRISRRNGPSLPPTRAATDRPQTKARATRRTQSGAARPSRTATSHRCATRSKALSWSANATAGQERRAS
eukprot:1658003-Lingulodinium_polyedra.AAC.1